MIAQRVVVHGRVQGVGYRYAMADAAAEANVKGWVRNRDDGAVEAHIQGNSEDVSRAIAWCRRGPPAARVTAVDVTEAQIDSTLRDFAIRGNP
jgi:acylphosphatase